MPRTGPSFERWREATNLVRARCVPVGTRTEVRLLAQRVASRLVHAGWEPGAEWLSGEVLDAVWRLPEEEQAPFLLDAAGPRRIGANVPVYRRRDRGFDKFMIESRPRLKLEAAAVWNTASGAKMEKIVKRLGYAAWRALSTTEQERWITLVPVAAPELPDTTTLLELAAAPSTPRAPPGNRLFLGKSCRLSAVRSCRTSAR